MWKMLFHIKTEGRSRLRGLKKNPKKTLPQTSNRPRQGRTISRSNIHPARLVKRLVQLAARGQSATIRQAAVDPVTIINERMDLRLCPNVSGVRRQKTGFHYHPPPDLHTSPPSHTHTSSPLKAAFYCQAANLSV